MPVQDVQSHCQLPMSHYFLTLSRGAGIRTFAIRSYTAYAGLAALSILVAVGLGSTFYMLFHDQVVAALMARQSQMQYAYEDRLDALRMQLQRETSRQVADQTSVDRSVRDLLSREAQLSLRADTLASLAGQGADRHGIEAANAGPTPARGGAGSLNPLARLQAAPALPEGLMSFAPARAPAGLPPVLVKPQPEALNVAPAADLATEASVAASANSLPIKTRLKLLSASLDRIEQAQVGSVVRLSATARTESDRMREALDDAGLSPDRFRLARPAAAGGPFVPLPQDKLLPFSKALDMLRTSLRDVDQMRTVIGHVPLAEPLPGSPEVTSPFGARVDPFLGRPALHTGVDLKQDIGANVRTAAAGRVSFAGPMGGYGNMVEIEHGNGLVSRYAHLSQIDCSQGDVLPRGAVVGEVGATGRATGPHLHYEVRIDGEPVDPIRFLNAGQRLARAETHF